MKLAEFSIKNSLLVNLITFFIIAAGLMSMFKLKREAFPPVDYDILTITTIYPGATTEDVEKLVTIPIEKELKGISGIKDLESRSEEGASVIGITLEPNVSDKAQVVQDIKDAVDRINNLPDEIDEDPFVFELKTKEFPVLEVYFFGGDSEDERRRYAEGLEDLILDVKGVSKVNRLGWRDRELWVEVYPQKMKDLHVSLDEIIKALASRNVTIPGGQLTTDTLEYNIRINAEFKSAQEISDVVIRANDSGNWLKIKDVARVVDTYQDEVRTAKMDGKATVGMIIIKSEEGDVIRVVEDVQKVIDQYKLSIPDTMDIKIVNDFSFYVNRRLGVLKNNGFIGFLLVLILLFLFLDPIPAFVTALGIPMALFITFIFMQFFNVTINLVSMLGLIIVLGMLVDDGIIVAENSYRYLEKGMSARDAAIKGTTEVIAPVTVTILTTCAAFGPLLFMTDILGKFIREIPIVVMVALCASLFEAFVILPSHFADFVAMSQKRSKGKIKKHKEKIWFKKVTNFYVRQLERALNFRYVFAVMMIVLLGASFYILKNHMKVILFSGEGIETFMIRAEAPHGTSLEYLNQLLKPVEQIVADLPAEEVEAYQTYLGALEMDGSFDPNSRSGTHLGQLTIFLTPAQKRIRTPKDISDFIRRQLENVEGFEKLYVYMPKEGPPIGRDISVGIKGEDYQTLNKIADQYVTRLQTIDGVSEVETSYNFGKKQLKIVVDEPKARQYYLSIAQIASSVRYAFKGAVATTIKPDQADKEISVVVRFAKEFRDNLNAFDDILIENTQGQLIPLKSVAKIEQEDGLNMINHLDGKRVVYVLGNVDSDKITSLEVNNLLTEEFAQIEKDNIGYTVNYTGEFEQQQESQANLVQSFSIAFAIIFIILATMFNSLIQPLIVMLAIPFGLIGVIFAFFLHGRPLSFFGLMGVIGLTGIVVNDSIVLVDFINRMRKEGEGRRESILEAGRTRLRPVIMTTVTTIGGLISVAYGIGGGDPFLKPMALAIVWGLTFSTVLILIMIPCIYAIMDDFTEKILHRGLIKLPANSSAAPTF